MTRRVSLPAADDLFRPTAPPEEDRPAGDARETGAETGGGGAEGAGGRQKKPSGRVRHDEKMTVYVTSDELLDLEHARLVLRRSHGLAVDRGRIVREAIALVLADFEAQGDDSALVRRLTEG
ncbi:MAG TPA: hypothetical protein VD864_13800 [Nocardioides sp.]|nr:hypothetical protein [Nocardioides sp.]